MSGNRLCLPSFGSPSQIEAVTVKLQGLQQKAILDDDYDAGKTFSRDAALISESSRPPRSLQGRMDCRPFIVRSDILHAFVKEKISLATFID